MYTSDTKIFEVVDFLKSLGEIRFDKDFYTPIGMTKPVFSNIKNQNKHPEGRQAWHFTAEHIRLICLHFNIDANYIFGLSDKIRKKQKIAG